MQITIITVNIIIIEPIVNFAKFEMKNDKKFTGFVGLYKVIIHSPSFFFKQFMLIRNFLKF